MKESTNKIRRYFSVLLTAVVAFSCTSTRTMLVELPEPSKKELPANVQSLTIVTQTVNNKYTDLEADSLQNLFYKQNFDLDTVIYDKQVVDTTIRALGELLFESGRYDFVIPQNRFINSNRISSPTRKLDWQMVKELTETYETDAVLSLDYLSTRVITDFDRESFFNPADNNFYAGAQAEMRISYNAVFRVYYPENESILVEEVMQDTLLWEDASLSVRELFQDFTPIKEALVETGILIALDLSDKISVIWDTDRRTFYHSGNDKFEQAVALVNSGDWLSAVELWKEVAEESKSKSLTSKAQYNVALGYEMIGDLNQAISWAVKSYKTMYRTLTYDYLEKLKERKTELKNRTK
ncbi:MAG TPA: DUF6340 family protein [Prolixibacteraceae bacterium]|nr:DUF6340 family protein [Prolixibacteraceae bacterium]